MKYDVTFSCGHTQTVQLFGKSADRARKSTFLRNAAFAVIALKSKKKSKIA